MQLQVESVLLLGDALGSTMISPGAIIPLALGSVSAAQRASTHSPAFPWKEISVGLMSSL